MKRNKKPHFIQSLFKGKDERRHERTVMEDSMATSRLIDYFQSFVENHPELVFVLSPDGEIISGNEYKINEVLGYRSKKRIDFTEYLRHKDYKLLEIAFYRAIKGIASRNELTVYDAKQTRIYFELTYIPIGLQEDEHAGVIITVRNITTRKNLENSNRLKTKHLEQTQELSEIGSLEYDIILDEFTCSPTFYTLTGLKESKKIDEKTLLSLFHQDEASKMKQLLHNAKTKGAGFLADCRIYHAKTKKLMYVQVKVDIVYQGEQPNKIVGILKDNTKAYLTEKNLIETYESYRYIFNHLSAGIWMRDAKEREIIFASESLGDMYQVAVSDIYAQPELFREMVVEEDRAALFQQYDLLHQGVKVDHRYQIIDRKGNRKWIYEQAIPRINEVGEITHIFGMKLDVTTEVENVAKLNFLAKHDRVTRLPNHDSFYDRLQAYTRDEKVADIALLYINLNNYTVLSNYLGYQLMDETLVTAKDRLMTCMEEGDYLAKVDDSAFILLVPNYQDKAGIFQLSEQVIDSLMDVIQIDEYEIYLTVSIGISFYPENGELPLTLIENAYSALYHAQKITEANYQIYSTEKDIQSHKKFMLERDLRKALENNEFELYYQAQISPRVGRLKSVEALIRWNHQDWGVVSPQEFIELAEETHLIHHIGNWVIEEVCKQIKSWQKKSLAVIPVAINISPIQILKTNFVDGIVAALEAHDIAPSLIEIEITESVLLKDEQKIIEDLQNLRKLGVKITLDDFGTGYSTFHYLQKLDIDKIKIDQSFIHQIMQNDTYETKEAAIVSSFLHLAKGLDIKVVAEGVETYEQLEFLQQHECDLVQGYIYSQAIEAEKFEKLLQEQYIKPQKRKKFVKPLHERRKYFRYIFTNPVIAQMEIIEVNHRKVNMGAATILLENISLGGLRFLSTLRLPINKNIKLAFHITILGHEYSFIGSLVYINEEVENIFSYGVSFEISEGEQNRLSRTINYLTVSKESNAELQKTAVVKQNPYLYLKEHS